MVFKEATFRGYVYNGGRVHSGGKLCSSIIWMKHQLNGFGLVLKEIPIKCDNMSAICLTKNPIQHSRTKHIEIRHHFIRDHVQNGDILIDFVCTDDNLADLFTKPLNADRFRKLVRGIGMLDP